MRHILFFVFYQSIQLLLLPFLIPFLFVRKMKGKSIFGSFKERFGFIPMPPKSKKIIWIHAVSVGEVLSIQNLINKIKQNNPNSFCYLTTGTIQGKNIAKANSIADQISFLPFDFLITMLLGFARINPSYIIVAEAEIWPNFLLLAKLKKIPIYLINARISKRAEKKYYRFRFLLLILFNCFNHIFTQSEKDTKSFESFGIAKEKLNTLGNIKLLNVLEKQENAPGLNLKLNFPILLIGSLHPGELDIYLNLFKFLKTKFNTLKMIIAPRHFHWQETLIQKIENQNLRYMLWDKEKQNINIVNELKTHDILLLCKLGELFNLYQLCDIFFLGGTFVPIGGHNLLEPAVWKKLSIVGPYHFNCQDTADCLEKENGLIKVKNQKELFSFVEDLLKNKSYKIMGENAYNWLIKESSTIEEKMNNFVKKLK